MKIRLYFDEDSMRRSLLRALRARGVDVITALDADMIERKDAEHLGYATQQGRVLCTFNARDFYRLHTDTWPITSPTQGSSLCASSTIQLESRCADSSD